MKLYIHAAQDVDKRGLAKTSDDPDVLAKLAEDEDEYVRWYVARNPNTSPEILAQLASDDDEDVRASVAKNPNTLLEVLTKLAEDKVADVRWAVAENPNTPLEILAKLADDESNTVRYLVAKNPNTPPEVLAKLAKDDDEDVRYVVAKNPNVSNKQNSKRKTWKSIVNQLESESERGTDPLYEQTEAGEYIESLQNQIEEKLNVWLEPSIQGGHGGIWIRDSKDDSTLAENIDYEGFNETTLDIACDSKNKKEFMSRYESYLESLI